MKYIGVFCSARDLPEEYANPAEAFARLMAGHGYSLVWGGSDDGIVWGVAHGMEYLITGIAVLIGGAVVYWGSFPLLFVIMGVIQLIAAIYQAQILRVEVLQ